MVVIIGREKGTAPEMKRQLLTNIATSTKRRSYLINTMSGPIQPRTCRGIQGMMHLNGYIYYFGLLGKSARDLVLWRNVEQCATPVMLINSILGGRAVLSCANQSTIYVAEVPRRLDVSA